MLHLRTYVYHLVSVHTFHDYVFHRCLNRRVMTTRLYVHVLYQYFIHPKLQKLLIKL